MVIFSIGILGLNTLQISSIKGNSKANNLTILVIEAQNQAEQLMSLDYNDPLLNIGANAVPQASLPTGMTGTVTVSQGANIKYINLLLTNNLSSFQSGIQFNFVKQQL